LSEDGQPDEAKGFDRKAWMREYNKLSHAKSHPRRLNYKGKLVYLDKNPRRGVCQQCGAVKGNDCKRTNIHHLEYDEKNVLNNTIELCVSCHAKAHGLGKHSEGYEDDGQPSEEKELEDLEHSNEDVYLEDDKIPTLKIWDPTQKQIVWIVENLDDQIEGVFATRSAAEKRIASKNGLVYAKPEEWEVEF